MFRVGQNCHYCHAELLCESLISDGLYSCYCILSNSLWPQKAINNLQCSRFPRGFPEAKNLLPRCSDLQKFAGMSEVQHCGSMVESALNEGVESPLNISGVYKKTVGCTWLISCVFQTWKEELM